MPQNVTRSYGKPAKQFGAVVAIALALAACGTTNEPNLADTAAFRMERYEEMQRVQEFGQCSQEGLTLDAEARSRASTGAFLSSARVLEGCISEISPSAEAVPEQQRMRVHALATINYFKGGDVGAARRSLDHFKANHTGKDLYLGNSTSFVESVEVLLGRTDGIKIGEFAALNVDTGLKREIRRINYWKNK